MLNAKAPKVRRYLSSPISVRLLRSTRQTKRDQGVAAKGCECLRAFLPEPCTADTHPGSGHASSIHRWAENFRCLRGKRTALAGDCGEGKRENVAIRAARAHELRGQISLQTLGLQVRFRMQLWERGKAVGRSAVAGGRGSERGKSDALRSRSGDTAQELTPTDSRII